MNQWSGTSSHVNGASKAHTEVCPTCGGKISREQLDRILRLGEAREFKLKEERFALEREREDVNLRRAEIAEAAAAEESAKWEVEAQRVAREIARLQKETVEKQQRLERAHKRELQEVTRTLAKMQTEIAKADAKAKAEIAKARAVAADVAESRVREAKRVAEDAQRAAIEALRADLKTSEQRRRREEDEMKKTIVVLQRKAESRERGHFGPDGEADLIAMLRDEFPGDRIEHHGTGGDVLHYVVDRGKTIARIIYEVKNTSGWQGAYVKQTRAAMELHNTAYGLLITRCLPARHSSMCVLDGVVVAVPAIAAQIVTVIREGIVAIARMDASEKDKASKALGLVNYVRGDDFVAAMKRITVKIGELRDSLSRERAHHDGWWRTRELGYTSVLREVSGIDARVADLLSGCPANDNADSATTEKVR
jgi:hypothetical protein